MRREERLGRTFVELADSLVLDFDVVDLLTLVAERSVELLAAAAAALMLRDDDGDLRPVAGTDAAAETALAREAATGGGPCIECHRTGRPVLLSDLDAEAERWPGLVARCREAGYRSLHVVPMRLRDEALGTLALFGAESRPMPAADVATAQAFADVATIAILQAEAVREARAVADQLRVALHSRIAIEQAKGVIAARVGIDTAEAFARLRRHARANRRMLTEVAQAVVDGTLPPTALG